MALITEQHDPSAHPTHKHYDQEVKFFHAFLDPYLKYSAGLWTDDVANVNEAALKMLDKIIGLFPQKKSIKILEVGSGWGALLKRCLERKDIIQNINYSAINPSCTQNQYLLSSISPDAKLYEQTFEKMDLTGWEEEFDVIVFLGSFGHLTDIQNTMFKLNYCLNSKGVLIIEDTLFLSRYHYNTLTDHPQTRFIQKEVFGLTPTPSFPELIEIAANAKLNLSYSLEHSDSYKKTLAHWIERIYKNQKFMAKHLKNSCIENIRYMELVQRGWGHTIGNYLMTFNKFKPLPNFVRTKIL